MLFRSTIASFMKYSLCIYLATMPYKKRTIIPLVLYEFSAIPSLLVGMRNPFIQNALFILAYYVLRNVIDNKEKWIGKIEKIILVVGIPSTLIFMTAFAFIRSGASVRNANPFKLLLGFFEGQGVTINVLSRGYGYCLNLPERDFRNYTFGGIIDYFVHGTVGQRLFGTSPLPDGNCYTNGRLSNNLAHNLSYTVMQDNYLKGQGLGSSYLLENYIDFGYIGVAVFSLVLGGILIYFMRGIKYNNLLNIIIMVSLTGIFYIPRAEATGWLTFIVTIQFWACTVGCYVGAWIIENNQWIYVLFKKLRLFPKE